MKGLHGVRSALPYDELELLTAELCIAIRQRDHSRGTILDLWREGGEVLGVWHALTNRDQPREGANGHHYILKMSHHYPAEHRDVWLGEDIHMYRGALRRGTYTTYYLERDDALDERPGGEIELVQEPGFVEGEEEQGEFDEDGEEGDEEL